MSESKTDVVRPTMADEHELALLRGLREGAPEAAGELYDRFGPKVLTFAIAWFPDDRQLAEDIVVQSLANAVRHIRRFDRRRSSLVTWLYAIARHQIRDEMRMRKRLKSVPPSAQTPIDHAAGIPDSQDMAATVVARVDAQWLLARLAAELSDIEYDILMLNCIDELSAKEIARVVGRSERAVHSLLHRAKKKARERLARDER